MNLNQLLLITLIIVLIMIIFKDKKRPQIIKKYITEIQQQPIQYDIRETLAPARRVYMRYPYYLTRSGTFLR